MLPGKIQESSDSSFELNKNLIKDGITESHSKLVLHPTKLLASCGYDDRMSPANFPRHK